MSKLDATRPSSEPAASNKAVGKSSQQFQGSPADKGGTPRSRSGSANSNVSNTSIQFKDVPGSHPSAALGTSRDLVAPKPKRPTPQAALNADRQGGYGTFGIHARRSQPAPQKSTSKPNASPRPQPSSDAAKPSKTQTVGTAHRVSADELIKRATLRDELLRAVKMGNTEVAADAVLQIPLRETDWRTYFPDVVPASGNQNLPRELGFAFSLRLRGRQLEAYLSHVEHHAKRSSVAEAAVRKDEYMMMFLRRVYDVSRAFRDTHEQNLTEKAKSLELLMDVTLKDSRAPDETIAFHLQDSLEQQPLVGLTTMLDKCAILEGHMDSKVLAEFRQCVKEVVNRQATAAESLVNTLKNREVDIDDLLRDARTLYAMDLTSAPGERRIGASATKPELEKMQALLRTLIPILRHQQGDSYSLLALHFVHSKLTTAQNA